MSTLTEGKQVTRLVKNSLLERGENGFEGFSGAFQFGALVVFGIFSLELYQILKARISTHTYHATVHNLDNVWIRATCLVVSRVQKAASRIKGNVQVVLLNLVHYSPKWHVLSFHVVKPHFDFSLCLRY